MPIVGLTIFAMILLFGPLWNKDCIDFMEREKHSQSESAIFKYE